MQVISCERAFNFPFDKPKISAIPWTPRSLELREAHDVIHTFLSMNEEGKMADRNYSCVSSGLYLKFSSICSSISVSSLLKCLEMHLKRVPCKSSEVHFLWIWVDSVILRSYGESLHSLKIEQQQHVVVSGNSESSLKMANNFIIFIKYIKQRVDSWFMSINGAVEFFIWLDCD